MMLPHREPSSEYLLRQAESVRKRQLGGRSAKTLQDVYAIAFWLAKRLQRRYPDVRIMVGDDGRGRMHHWLEIPAYKLFIDPAHDATESSEPAISVGSIEEGIYREHYRNALNSNFDVSEPRHQPR